MIIRSSFLTVFRHNVKNEDPNAVEMATYVSMEKQKTIKKQSMILK